MSRNEVARNLGIDERLLRHWERAGLLPHFRDVAPRRYRNRAAIILAARRTLSMQDVREAFAIGGV